MVIHLFPTLIVQYADGFTSASQTPCGEGAAEPVDCLHDFRSMQNTMLIPYAVTCKNCIRSSKYAEAIAAYESGKSPPYEVSNVPRMAHRIYKKRGQYDAGANNQVRDWLGIVRLDVSRERREELLHAEDEIFQGYAEKRKRAREVDDYMARHGIKGEIIVSRSYDISTGEMREDVTIIVDEEETPKLPKS